jgi:predicted nucleic acid-binding protein
LGLLLDSKQKGLLTELNPIFEKSILVGRYFSKELLNDILIKIGESEID